MRALKIGCVIAISYIAARTVIRGQIIPQTIIIIKGQHRIPGCASASRAKKFSPAKRITNLSFLAALHILKRMNTFPR